jgi:hypothetical protein
MAPTVETGGRGRRNSSRDTAIFQGLLRIVGLDYDYCKKTIAWSASLNSMIPRSLSSLGLPGRGACEMSVSRLRHSNCAPTIRQSHHPQMCLPSTSSAKHAADRDYALAEWDARPVTPSTPKAAHVTGRKHPESEPGSKVHIAMPMHT